MTKAAPISLPLMTVAAVVCALLFAAPALFPSLYLLSWGAFVPFLLVLQGCRSAWQAYGFGMFTGYLAWAFVTYGIAEFVQLFKGYSLSHSLALASLYWFYCAQSFAIVALVTHFARRDNALLWVFPVVLTLTMALYPFIFPWQNGNSQSEFLVAIQAVDIAGVSGLDFIIAIVNVLLVQALVGRSIFFARSASLAYSLVALWFFYGAVSLYQWNSADMSESVFTVGIVQPDEPPTIGVPGPRAGYSLSYPVEMEMSEKLVAAGAELIIWPELRNKQYYTRPYVKAAYQRQVAGLSTPLLFQSFEPDVQGDQALNFNSATFIDDDGNETGRYRKVRRIAIAEYLPFFKKSNAVSVWIRQYLGKFFGDFSAGSGPVRFDVKGTSITPFICYEALFPDFVASSVAATGGDIITMQSNNSWFGDTRVPYLHMSASVLRSVEARRPLVHVMNNGLGGVVLSSGRILLRTDRHEIAGYLVDIPYQKNAAATFYSRFPHWLMVVLGLSLTVMLVRAWRKT